MKVFRLALAVVLIAAINGCGDSAKKYNDNLPPVDASKKDTLKPVGTEGPKSGTGGADVAK